MLCHAMPARPPARPQANWPKKASLALEADGEFYQKFASYPDPAQKARDYIGDLAAYTDMVYARELEVRWAAVLQAPSQARARQGRGTAQARARAWRGRQPLHGCAWEGRAACRRGGAARGPTRPLLLLLTRPHPRCVPQVNVVVSYLNMYSDPATDPFPTLAILPGNNPQQSRDANQGLVRAPGARAAGAPARAEAAAGAGPPVPRLLTWRRRPGRPTQEFIRSRWNGNAALRAQRRTTVHYLSGQSTNGGVAYVGALCNSYLFPNDGYGYGFSGGYSGGFNWNRVESSNPRTHARWERPLPFRHAAWHAPARLHLPDALPPALPPMQSRSRGTLSCSLTRSAMCVRGRQATGTGRKIDLMPV